jgi:hypothetical protein
MRNETCLDGIVTQGRQQHDGSPTAENPGGLAFTLTHQEQPREGRRRSVLRVATFANGDDVAITVQRRLAPRKRGFSVMGAGDDERPATIVSRQQSQPILGGKTNPDGT